MVIVNSLFLAISEYVSSLLIDLHPFVVPLRLTLYFLLLSYGVFQLMRTLMVITQANKAFTILELQPLKKTEISPYATQQLFTVIHALASQRPLLLRFLNLTQAYSFEIVATKERGITYCVRVPTQDAALLQKTVISYLPGLKVKESQDYLKTRAGFTQVTTYRLTRHFAFPLLHHDSLERYDPIAYLTGSMTKVSKTEVIVFQVVLSPLNKSSVPAISRISNLIYSGKDLIGTIEHPDRNLVTILFFIIIHILLLPLGLVVFIATNGRDGPLLKMGNPHHQKIPSPYQSELEKLLKHKLDQPLFRSSLRLLTASNTPAQLSQRERSFSSALSSLSNADYQSLARSPEPKLPLIQKIKWWFFNKRLPHPFSSLILSASEVSALYHLPFTQTTKTEDLSKQSSKELPAPLSLKQTHKLDVVFAQNHYGGTVTPIGLTQEERRRHVYILGATGTGKSTLLLSMIKQDLEHNKGLCLIDPHGDLTDQVLSIIPDTRVEDVVYFNPDDIGYPMGINLLELTPGLNPDDAIREKELIAESIISIFHKIYSERYSGPRMEIWKCSCASNRLAFSMRC